MSSASAHCGKRAEADVFSAKAFYLGRFFRIAPPPLLYLCVCLGLSLSGAIAFSVADFLSAALYLCNTTVPRVSCG